MKWKEPVGRFLRSSLTPAGFSRNFATRFFSCHPTLKTIMTSFVWYCFSESEQTTPLLSQTIYFSMNFKREKRSIKAIMKKKLQCTFFWKGFAVFYVEETHLSNKLNTEILITALYTPVLVLDGCKDVQQIE